MNRASEAAISMPGAFAGTPEFASPEQFAGVGVDIRSDLYSLGVTLWEMVTGQTPFRGTSAEVMYQHQHAPLPLEQLKRVPQPVVVLLEVLLEKDPARRFQNPTELLKAMPTITGAIDAGGRITRKSLQKMPPAASPVVTRKPTGKIGTVRTPSSLAERTFRRQIPKVGARCVNHARRDPCQRKFQSPDCPLPEAMFLVERRISLSWMMHGQTSM